MAIYNDLCYIGGYIICLSCYNFQKKLNLGYSGFRGMRKTIYCTFHVQRNVGMELESVHK